MSWKSKTLITLAVFPLVFMVPMAVATSAISISPNSQSAYEGKTIDYTVTVYNEDENAVDATLEVINITGENWDWHLSENSFTIGGHETKEVSLSVTIGESLNGGNSTATVQLTYNESSFTTSATAKSSRARGITFGLKLTLIGMGSVFALLTLLMVLVKIVERFWGPKQGEQSEEEG
jgi:hypothetical protein